jgi:hypothetical protein
MIIQETSSGSELAPKKPQNAVCVAVIDVGESYGIPPNTNPEAGPLGVRLVPAPPKSLYPEPKEAVRFIFESEELKEDKRPFRLTYQANCTMSDKGNLKPFLDSWGVELVRTSAGLDLEASCVGKSVKLNVVHDDKGETTWANISTVMPSEVELQPSGEFNKSEYMKYCEEQYKEKQNKNR